MSYRKLSNLFVLNSLLTEQVLPIIGSLHLDFGCGTGIGATILAMELPKSRIIGYDKSPECISRALKYPRENQRFTSDRSELERIEFDSVGANFVLHEDPAILEEIGKIASPGTTLYVLDYNMKGMPQRQFRKCFCLDNERRVFRREGEKTCYRKHTSRGVEDCIQAGNAAGFSTLKTHSYKNYFVWIGKKNNS